MLGLRLGLELGLGIVLHPARAPFWDPYIVTVDPD